jgi:hypothetical protein
LFQATYAWFATGAEEEEAEETAERSIAWLVLWSRPPSWPHIFWRETVLYFM